MRRLLIDHARRHRAARRGGGDVVHTDAIHVADASPDPVDAIALDDAITKLTTLDARQGRVAELRCFAGMEFEEIAEVLRVSVRTVKRDWATARLLLRSELGATAKVRAAAEGRA
jgi:RNA polymerase sigma factor (TIGR02999 family)